MSSNLFKDRMLQGVVVYFHVLVMFMFMMVVMVMVLVVILMGVIHVVMVMMVVLVRVVVMMDINMMVMDVIMAQEVSGVIMLGHDRHHGMRNKVKGYGDLMGMGMDHGHRYPFR